MPHNNVSPQLVSGGNIYPSRFVKLSTAADNTALQAGANDPQIGISQVGTKDAPGLTGASAYAAEAGDNIQIWGLGDICLLEAGAGGWTRGDRLKSDADGKGVPIAGTGANQHVGAYALESAAANEFGRVQIILLNLDPDEEAESNFGDDQPLYFGASDDAGFEWSTNDASNHAFVMALGDTSEALHITDVAAKDTDWNVSADTHPTVYIHSNTTPATDYLKLGSHDATTGHIESVGGSLNLTGVGEVVVNEASADVNFRVESNALANFLLVDAAECLNGCLAIGAAAPTNPQAMLALVPPANASGVTTNQSYSHMDIAPGGATTIPAGTAPVVSSLNVHEPNITATGTVTAAATVHIVDAPSEGSANYALWVDAGTTRLDGDVNVADAAVDIVVKANTAAALEVYDSTTKIVAVDTRNTLKNTSAVTITGVPVTVASETAAHINASLNIAAKTITYTGSTGTTSSLGTMLYVGIPTLTDASAMTIDVASAVHINAVAAAGGSLTITASRMISTSVSDCFLTNAGVWTDTACWSWGKSSIGEATTDMIDSVLEKLTPRSWTYNPEVHGNDHGRERVGIVYDELPEELRAPGQKSGVSAGVLSSFALAAIKSLWERNQDLEARLARLEGAA